MSDNVISPMKFVSKEDNANESSDDEGIFISRKFQRRKVVDSDEESDEEIVSCTNASHQKIQERPESAASDGINEMTIKHVRRRVVASSDDESFDGSQHQKKDLCNDENDSLNSAVKSLATSREDISVGKVCYNRDIFDTELSDEEEVPLEQHLEYDKKKKSKENKGKNKQVKLHARVSAKARATELQEIHQETQRIVRESVVSLPCHKPKQRTLAEFLNRKNATAAVSGIGRSDIKTSMKSIEVLRLLEKKKQEVEEFYRSDSDEEDVNDEEWRPPCTVGRLPEKVLPNILPQIAVLTNIEPVYDDELPDLMAHTELAEKISCMSKNDPKLSDTLEQVVNDDEVADDSGVYSQPPSRSQNSPISGDSGDSEMNGNTLNVLTIENVSTHSEHRNKTDTLITSLNSSELAIKSCDISDVPVAANIPSTVNLHNDLLFRLPDITKFTPRLTKWEDDSIPDCDVNESGVQDLMTRFLKHTQKKLAPEKKSVDISVVSKETSTDGCESLVTSHIMVDCKEHGEVQAAECIPGARMVSLRSALQRKIREKREKDRLRRTKEKEFMDAEKIVEDYYDDGALPNEEDEAELSCDSEFESESEPEENDLVFKEKKRARCLFVDDQAEEDDDSGDMADDAQEEENYGDNQGKENDIDNSEDKDTDNYNDPIDEPDESDSCFDIPRICRKNIIEDDEEDIENWTMDLRWDESQNISQDVLTGEREEKSAIKSQEMSPVNSLSTVIHYNSEDMFAERSEPEGIQCNNSVTSIDSSFEIFGTDIPGHQPGRDHRHKQSVFLTTYIADSKDVFISPEINSSRKSSTLDEKADKNDSYVLTNKSPSIPDLNLTLNPFEGSQFSLQSPFIETSQATPTSQGGLSLAAKLCLDWTDDDDDNAVNLCSGRFGEKSKPSVQDLCTDDFAQTQDINDVMGLCSGHFSSPVVTVVGHSGLANLVTTESENDELLQLCTGKFNSQVDETEQKERVQMDAESEKQNELIYSSDEEGIYSRQVHGRKKKKEKRRRIVAFSDDEDAQDAQDATVVQQVSPQTAKFTTFKDKIKGGIRADFLEAEAELSGSDFDSEDEDEPNSDQDVMEQEEGDLEYYDEDELRNQVGRAHMKEVLDGDKRQLMLLQEMYLEDGDLHGQGRQRKFRWQNHGDEDNDEEQRNGSEEEPEEDEQEDTAWRKQRYEREKFLSEKKEEPVTESVDAVIPILHSISSSSSDKRLSVQPCKEGRESKSSCTPPLTPFTGLSKRGSFLSRDKNTLARIAEFTKEKGNGLGGAKKGGNFTFQHLSVEEVQLVKDGKEDIGIPAKKRVCLDRSRLSLDETSLSATIFRHFKM